MKTKVEIMSRKAMKELIESGFPENTAVISFYDPNDGRGLARLKEYEPINYNGICDYVFTVGVHDIDIETLEDYETRFVKVFFCKRISKEQWGCHTSFVWQPLRNLTLLRS